MKSIGIKRWLLYSVVLFALAGCGQKGPLFLPEDDDQEDDQQSVIEPSVYLA